VFISPLLALLLLIFLLLLLQTLKLLILALVHIHILQYIPIRKKKEQHTAVFCYPMQ